MAIVNVLRFNELSGAMISDEEYWVWGRRRSFFTDHIYPICDEPIKQALGMELLYGGTGHPPFHYELTDHLKKRLMNTLDGSLDEPLPMTTEAVGYLLLDEAQKTYQRRINNQLQFLYGVTVEDVNRGFTEYDGKRYDINQNLIKQDVVKLVNQSSQDEMLKPLAKSRGVLVGIDPVNGFSIYFLNYDKSVMAFSSGGFEAIGTGKYASGISIAQFLNTVNLTRRRAGIDPVEGVFTLYLSALMASESFREVGGYFSLALLSVEKKGGLPGVKYVQGSRSKLATEIVQAFRLEQLSRHKALELLDGLVFGEANIEKVEQTLFREAKNATLLELRLAGYKADVNDFVAEISSSVNSLVVKKAKSSPSSKK